MRRQLTVIAGEENILVTDSLKVTFTELSVVLPDLLLMAVILTELALVVTGYLVERGAAVSGP